MSFSFPSFQIEDLNENRVEKTALSSSHILTITDVDANFLFSENGKVSHINSILQLHSSTLNCIKDEIKHCLATKVNIDQKDKETDVFIVYKKPDFNTDKSTDGKKYIMKLSIYIYVFLKNSNETFEEAREGLRPFQPPCK